MSSISKCTIRTTTSIATVLTCAFLEAGCEDTSEISEISAISEISESLESSESSENAEFSEGEDSPRRWIECVRLRELSEDSDNPDPSDASMHIARKDSPAVCQINRGGYWGSYFCKWKPCELTWPGGRKQVFLVSTDYHVYDSYQMFDGTWTRWRDLDGIARSNVTVWLNTEGPSLTITVLGTDYKTWCKYWHSTGFTKWVRCPFLRDINGM
jgi:hypothetical protein